MKIQKTVASLILVLVAISVLLYFSKENAPSKNSNRVTTEPDKNTQTNAERNVKVDSPSFEIKKEALNTLPMDQLAGFLEYDGKFNLKELAPFTTETPLAALPYVATARRVLSHYKEIGLLWQAKDPTNMAPKLLLFHAYMASGSNEEAIKLIQSINSSQKFDLYLKERYAATKSVLANNQASDEAMALIANKVSNDKFHQAITAKFSQDIYTLAKESLKQSNTDAVIELASTAAAVHNQISKSDPQAYLANRIVDDTEVAILQKLDGATEYGDKGQTVNDRISEIKALRQVGEAENEAVNLALSQMTLAERIQWQDVLMQQGTAAAYAQLLNKK